MNDDKYFQNKLISLRNDANLSQQQIAEKLNIARPFRMLKLERKRH